MHTMIIIMSLSKLTSHGVSYGKQLFDDEHVHMWCRVRVSLTWHCTHKHDIHCDCIKKKNSQMKCSRYHRQYLFQRSVTSLYNHYALYN